MTSVVVTEMPSSQLAAPSPSQIARLAAPNERVPTTKLQLPPICPVPEPGDEELRLINSMSQAVDVRNQLPALGQRARGLSAQKAGQNGLDGFLGFNDGKPGRAGGGRGGRAAPRPTQRQPVDDMTSIPAEVHDSMMRLGSEARKRSSHQVAYAEETGKPYLRHRDAASLLAQKAAAQAAEAEAAAAAAEAKVAESKPTSVRLVTFSPRPLSACASEMAEARADLSQFGWMSPLEVSVHVQ